jgi:hypothetical protein
MEERPPHGRVPQSQRQYWCKRSGLDRYSQVISGPGQVRPFPSSVGGGSQDSCQQKLFDLLLKPQEELDTTLPLVNLGLNSLVAIELRSWFKQVFSFAIPMLEMLGMGSLDLYARFASVSSDGKLSDWPSISS